MFRTVQGILFGCLRDRYPLFYYISFLLSDTLWGFKRLGFAWLLVKELLSCVGDSYPFCLRLVRLGFA